MVVVLHSVDRWLLSKIVLHVQTVGLFYFIFDYYIEPNTFGKKAHRVEKYVCHTQLVGLFH